MKYFFILAISLISNIISAQSSIQFKGTSLKPGDSCTLIIQKSSENFYEKKVIVGSDSTVNYTFSNISNGKWALKVDATGYYYPATQVFDLTNKSILVEFKFMLITLANSVDYIYQWNDDSSYLGHAQQSYINGQPDYKILNDPIKVPDDFSSINLISRNGIALSNKITSWSSEDAYRLYQMVKRIPALNPSNDMLGTFQADVKSVWEITNDDIIDDISISIVSGIKYVRVSRNAFVYATPLVAELDGIKGRFFSKRLYNAVVAYATNFGNDVNAIGAIASQNFGIKFLEPGNELRILMNEDVNNFQSFSAFEKLTILSMFEELPDGMHAQSNLKFLVHRIAGQDNAKYPAAAAIAWTGIGCIEFMQKAFNAADYGSIQRLILHEKTHFLWAGLFDQKLKDDWAILGGWYVDPTSPTGWSTTNTTEFVSAYAHLKNPDEDMAETVATYVTNPDLLSSRSLRKFEFIRDRVMHGTRYVSMIRKDLTFTVYNLFPDFNYPGKIEGINVSVAGLPNQDKKLTIEVKIHAIDSLRDGASYGYTRISSSIGTFFDMYLNPVNGNPFLLRGEISITKFAKNGYYTVNQIMLADAAGNKRYENNNTFGLKIFINNPLEDLLPAKYKESTLKLSMGSSKFSSFSTNETNDGNTYQYVQAKFDVVERNAISYIGINYAIPTNEAGVYKGMQFGVMGNDPRYLFRDTIINDLTHVTYRFPIPEYYPNGFYPITQIFLRDEPQNEFRETFMNDTTGFKVAANQQKHVRDSILIRTKYPDYIPPILDVNAITIKANPTNPKTPDGETLFEMEFFAKDSSSYPGNEAGIQNGTYILRDPQGKQFSFGMQGDFDKIAGNFYYLLNDPSGTPGIWRKYKVSTLLPKGSSPGLWGVESISLSDRAQNFKFFNFVELVRFDIEEKDSAQKVNPIVEILGKKVNAKNVDSASISISCKSCVNKIYRTRIYSDMGGESVVYEGVMSKDSIVVSNIKLKGVKDGVLYATVFILDTSRVLLGIGKATYTKDVIAPSAAILKTNLSSFGNSNIDSLVFDIKVSELSGSYNVVLKQLSIVKANSINSNQGIIKSFSINNFATKVGDSLLINGQMSGSTIKLTSLPISQFEDGIIEIATVFVDSVGNESAPVKTTIYKDTKAPIASIKKSAITDLKANYAIEINEYISNSLSTAGIVINTGKIDSLVKVSNRSYNLYLTRICNDTVLVTIKANTLLDTVGNKNTIITFVANEKIVPASPIVAPVAYCVGANPNALTATNITSNNLLWYGSSVTGGTSSVTAPTPITSNVGSFDYYVSQSTVNTGCESPRSKLTVNIYPIPATPSMTRDTVNNLISTSSYGNIWYKDGVLLSDTNRIFKPTLSGLYTVKTNQNGCLSLTAGTYYFIVTDIINLSSNEFIKLAPNPFINQLNFDFIVRGYQKLNLVFISMPSGSLVASRQGVFPGSQINLAGLASGVYLVRISSEDGKLSYQFKMVKM